MLSASRPGRVFGPGGNAVEAETPVASIATVNRLWHGVALRALEGQEPHI